MSSFVLEQIRSQHADVEELEAAAVGHIIAAHRPTATAYDRLRHEHEVKRLMADMQQKMRRTLQLYTEETSLRQQQEAEIRDVDGSWLSFYSTLADIRLMGSKQQLAAPLSASSLPSSDSPSNSLPAFTAEESLGRHLDLTSFHLRYINIAFHPRVDYLGFLSSFHSSFASIPRSRKTKSHHSPQYRLYLSDLLQYLRGFVARTRPLAPLHSIDAMIRDEFDTRWRERRLEGWFEQEVKVEERKEGEQANGNDAEEKQQSSLYCAACRKPFAKSTVFNAHLTGKKHIKAQQELDAAAAAAASTSASSSSPSASPPTAAPPRSEQLAHDLAELEFGVHQFALLLSPTIDATISFAQHKQTLTPSELQAEIAAFAAEAAASSSSTAASSSSGAESDDESGPIHNPLHLPLDWTGKPIPYWLYKLNGLNQTFPCEICGGYSYVGPKQYREHFSQWRHAWGMRCLGVPNLKHFVGVVKMDEVKALWERMKAEERQRTWKEDEEEEMEDAEGNVFNKKTFLELQRQGLI